MNNLKISICLEFSIYDLIIPYVSLAGALCHDDLLRVWAFTRWQSPCYNIEVTGYAKSASPLPEIRCVHLNLTNPRENRRSSSGLPYPYNDPSGAVPRRVGFLEPKPFIRGGHRSEEVTIYPPYCHNHVKWSSFKYLFNAHQSKDYINSTIHSI